MNTVFDKFSRFGQKTYNGQDVLKNHFLQIYPIHYTDNTKDESVVSMYADRSDFVWIVDKNIEILRTFPWHFRPVAADYNKKHVFPYIYKNSKRIKDWEKAKLVPTKTSYTDIVEHKNIAGIYDVYCGKDRFDLFYIGDEKDQLFAKICERVPNAIVVKSHTEAQQKSTTDMFWLVPNDIELGDFFKFSYKPDDWSHNYVHVFGNGDSNTFDGIALFPKHYNPTSKELQHRFYAEKKTINLIASKPKSYPVFTFSNYNEYLLTLNTVNTDCFWYVPNDVELHNDLSLYFNHHNQFDRQINHVFLNDKDYDGVILFSKHSPVTEKEFEHRFLINKKEHPEIYSWPKKFDQFVINNYADYKLAQQHSSTEMFWGVPSDVDVKQEFDFNFYISHHDRFNRNITHVFINDKTYDGVVLFSKHVDVTEKEVEHRFYSNKKEHNVLASTPKNYPLYKVDTYDDYLEALEKSNNDLFWISSANIDENEKIYNFYISHHQQSLRKQNHVFLHQGTETSYNGLILCSKYKTLSKKEVAHRHPVERIEHNEIFSKNKKYPVFVIETYNDYLHAIESSSTEMFWMTSPNISTENFKFDITFDFSNKYDRKQNHAFAHNDGNSVTYNGVFLCSKHKLVTAKEIEHRHFIEVKQWDIVASAPIVYDQFIIETYDDYLNALENSKTEMFWGISKNINCKNFDFSLSFNHNNSYDRNTNHAFIHLVDNKEYYNGLFLFTKHKPVTQKEIEHRHIIEAKEWNIVASIPVLYNKFNIDTYNDYLDALESSQTEMFWGIPTDVNVSLDFKFDLYFTHDNVYDRKINHVMLNGEHRDGIVLFSKHSPVTQKEVENRFYVNKKDWDILASTPKPYEFYNIVNYNDYLEALENSPTELFWASTPNIKLDKEFDTRLYFSHHNTYDRSINHAFVHRVNGEDHYNGLFLLTKRAPLTQKEIEHKLIAKRKEWNTVASGPVEYETFIVDTYEDYEIARNSSETEMFWMIPPEVNVDTNFKFDLYFTHNQRFERETNHVFKNGNAWDGISLVSKKSAITEREINMRFLANKKQYDVVASTPNLYDIVFISKDEEHADTNYSKLLERFPRAKRVHGVTGIHQAHIEAAKLCDSEMFWVVDADAEIVENFDFDYYIPAYDPDGRKTVHVWKSKNPINGLIYGYGAVKLLPRQLTLNIDVNTPDMTTSISKLFKSVNRISNITNFNTDEFSTWRSAFRECVKLSSRTIRGQLDEESEFRLNVWCTRGKNKMYGEQCIAGAKLGRIYGSENKDDSIALAKINDFDWLYQQFKKSSNQ